MATLQKIRNRSVLLLVAIGVALLGFILTDALTNGNAILAFNKNYVAKVDGQKLTQPAFEARVTEVSNLYKRQGSSPDILEVREQTWNQVLHELIMQHQYKKLGIAASSAEVLDMYVGKYVSPIVRQQIKNPETGAYDKNYVQQVLAYIDREDIPDAQRQNWYDTKTSLLSIEREMIAEREQSKYANLLTKAMNTTKYEAQMAAQEKANAYNFEYVYIPYTSVKNEDLKISDSDLKAFYNTHKELYKVEKSREIKYVTFPLAPSSEDHRKAKEAFYALVNDFKTTSNDVDFAEINSEEKTPIVYKTSEELEATYQKTAFSDSIGTVFEPVFDNKTNIWTAYRIHDRKMLPDSVKVSVLPITPKKEDTQETYNARVDSIFNLAKHTTDFETLATQPQQKQPDGTLNIGWKHMHQGIPDSCFFQANNEIYKLNTQKGAVIIKITDQSKRVEKVAFTSINKEVNFSSETQRATYALAAQFLTAGNTSALFDSVSAKENLFKRNATISENDFSISGLGDCREMIKWAYGAKKDEISSIQEINDNLVIACVSQITEKGYRPLDQIQSAVKLALLRDKRIETCKENMQKAMNSTDLAAVAKNLNMSITSASNISAQSPTITDIGSEPNVVIAATYAPENKLVGPVVGNSGIFALRVTSKTKLENTTTPEQEQQRAEMMRNYILPQQVYGALSKAIQVDDNRSRFY